MLFIPLAHYIDAERITMPETLLYCVIGYTVFMRNWSAEIFEAITENDGALMGLIVFIMMNTIVIMAWPLFLLASKLDDLKRKRLLR